MTLNNLNLKKNDNNNNSCRAMPVPVAYTVTASDLYKVVTLSNVGELIRKWMLVGFSNNNNGACTQRERPILSVENATMNVLYHKRILYRINKVISPSIKGEMDDSWSNNQLESYISLQSNNDTINNKEQTYKMFGSCKELKALEMYAQATSCSSLETHRNNLQVFEKIKCPSSLCSNNNCDTCKGGSYQIYISGFMDAVSGSSDNDKVKIVVENKTRINKINNCIFASEFYQIQTYLNINQIGSTTAHHCQCLWENENHAQMMITELQKEGLLWNKIVIPCLFVLVEFVQEHKHYLNDLFADSGKSNSLSNESLELLKSRYNKVVTPKDKENIPTYLLPNWISLTSSSSSSSSVVNKTDLPKIISSSLSLDSTKTKTNSNIIQQRLHKNNGMLFRTNFEQQDIN